MTIRKVSLFSLWLALVVLGSAEVLLRASGRYATYTEKTLGYYESYYDKVLGSWLWTWSPYTTNTRQSAEFIYEVITNREGIRDIDHDPIKPPGTFRIIITGDSYTEGVGAEFTNAWFRVLQRSLTRQNKPVEVISAGVGGSDVVYDAMLLAEKMLHYDPDLVLVMVNSTDLDDLILRGGFERFHDDGTVRTRKAPWVERIYRYSHLARMIIHGPMRRNGLLLTPAENDTLAEEARSSVLEAFTKIAALGRQHDFSARAYIYPTPDKAAKRHDVFKEAFFHRAESLPMPTINLFPAMADQLNDASLETYTWPIDMHFNTVGYAWFARLVEEDLHQAGVLP